MCKIFGITVDEFTRLASDETLPTQPVSSPAPSEPSHSIKQIPENNTLNQSSPENNAAPENFVPAPDYKKGKEKKVLDKVNRHISPWKFFSLIFAILAGLDAFIGLNFVLGWSLNLFMLAAFFAGYFVFSFIACIGHDTVVWDFLEACFFKSFHLSGLIFTLDINGILFLIVYKFIIAPLVTVFLWVGCVIRGLIISLVMAGFVFSFCTPKIFRGTFWGTGE